MKATGTVTALIVLGACAATVALAACFARADVTERDKAASEVALGFVKELGEAMTKEMTKGGPTEAIKVCAELAPEIPAVHSYPDHAAHDPR